jgi:3-isopropylmalate/(R)-2-methylmalate dehydratase small subunit
MIDSIDTDVITSIPRVLEGGDSLVRYAFEPLRYLEDGSPNPDFPLNQARYEGARILIAGANFGCGSSRETAAWAVKGLGLKVVIAASFGEIFLQNLFKNGLLPIQLNDRTVGTLAAQADGAEFVVDLASQRITAPDGTTTPFEINAFRRQGLLEGLDELDLVLTKADAVRAFQERDREARPWIYR